jgi:hypothetical protein
VRDGRITKTTSATPKMTNDVTTTIRRNMVTFSFLAGA